MQYADMNAIAMHIGEAQFYGRFVLARAKCTHAAQTPLPNRFTLLQHYYIVIVLALTHTAGTARHTIIMIMNMYSTHTNHRRRWVGSVSVGRLDVGLPYSLH